MTFSEYIENLTKLMDERDLADVKVEHRLWTPGDKSVFDPTSTKMLLEEPRLSIDNGETILVMFYGVAVKQ